MSLSAFDARRMSLALAVRVRHRRSAATLPTDPHPPVQVVKINMTGQHQQACGYEFFAAAVLAGEPSAGDGTGALCPDVVSAPRHFAEMIDQGLEFGALRG